MLPIDGRPILTAAAMRAAEEAHGDFAGLMQRAGAGVAEAARRLAAGAEVLVLCGPGNNGGDGYVAATVLREAGHPVRVAAFAEPKTDLACAARARWTGIVEQLNNYAPAPILVDALFGTGLSRSVEAEVIEQLQSLVLQSRLSIAVDLPTGVEADTGGELNRGEVADFDLTLALGAIKPAHVLMPAAERCGTVRLIDIGLDLDSASFQGGNDNADDTIAQPLLGAPSRSHHKYLRGQVIVVGGLMPGAAALAVTAAMRTGAGYGLLFSNEQSESVAYAIVQKRWSPDVLMRAIQNKRNNVVVIGPGLGRDDEARAKLDAVIDCGQSLIIDGDALQLLEERHFAIFREWADAGPNSVVLTPHAGEFAALFGKHAGSKIEAARAAARRSGAIVVYKGSDTVVAHPIGCTTTLLYAPSWLSTAGTGDVLTGAIAGVWQSTIYPAEAGVWLHAEAARRCGPSFIADDLAAALTPARASLCR